MVAALLKTPDGRYVLSPAAATIAAQPREITAVQRFEQAVYNGLGFAIAQHGFAALVSGSGSPPAQALALELSTSGVADAGDCF